MDLPCETESHTDRGTSTDGPARAPRRDRAGTRAAPPHPTTALSFAMSICKCCLDRGDVVAGREESRSVGGRRVTTPLFAVCFHDAAANVVYVVLHLIFGLYCRKVAIPGQWGNSAELFVWSFGGGRCKPTHCTHAHRCTLLLAPHIVTFWAAEAALRAVGRRIESFFFGTNAQIEALLNKTRQLNILNKPEKGRMSTSFTGRLS